VKNSVSRVPAQIQFFGKRNPVLKISPSTSVFYECRLVIHGNPILARKYPFASPALEKFRFPRAGAYPIFPEEEYSFENFSVSVPACF
jgi:hypothetical protein